MFESRGGSHLGEREALKNITNNVAMSWCNGKTYPKCTLETHNAQVSLEKSDKCMKVPCPLKLTFPVISKISVEVNTHTLNALPYSSVLPPQLILMGRERGVMSVITARQVPGIFIPWGVATGIVSYKFG